MRKIGFKIDNCISDENISYFYEILKELKVDQPIEFGLECYGEKRYFDKESILVQLFEEKLKFHKNKIIHLILKGKILNIAAFSEKEWEDIWMVQNEIVKRINPSYLICHATSHESKIYSIEKQIENICDNFIKLTEIFKYPLFVENTYEDLDFYKKLFNKAPKDMNFVLDIGHMKVHSRVSKESWVEFLIELKNEGRNIHFHIHDNNGEKDEHINISVINNIETIIFVKELLSIFPESNFIIETHSHKINLALKDIELLSF